MNANTINKSKWFWPWQDEKEEAWLEKMSGSGWHLKSMQLPCRYTFASGDPGSYAYRLDYMPSDKAKWDEYRQIFEDAGWQYIGEMSNWRYWRKLIHPGETVEIFTDSSSKIKKYRRLLSYMLFFLFILIFYGYNLLTSTVLTKADHISPVLIIYLIGAILYAVIIPVYFVVVIKIVRRMHEIQQKSL